MDICICITESLCCTPELVQQPAMLLVALAAQSSPDLQDAPASTYL